MPPESPRPTEGRVGVVVVAAGRSTRMGTVDKTFAPLNGIPLIAHTLSHLQSCPLVDEIVLVLSAQNLEPGRTVVDQHNFGKVSQICAGGERRQDSVQKGLAALQPCQWVMVHDGARPGLDQQILERGLLAVPETGAAVAGVPVTDTIKQVSANHSITGTPPRETLWAAQTPQIFEYQLLMQAHRNCRQTVTDDAAMVEDMGHTVKMFLGSYSNLKVTTPQDLTIMKSLLDAGPASRSPV